MSSGLALVGCRYAEAGDENVRLGIRRGTWYLKVDLIVHPEFRPGRSGRATDGANLKVLLHSKEARGHRKSLMLFCRSSKSYLDAADILSQPGEANRQG